jgi:hypothetical protein
MNRFSGTKKLEFSAYAAERPVSIAAGTRTGRLTPAARQESNPLTKIGRSRVILLV